MSRLISSFVYSIIGLLIPPRESERTVAALTHEQLAALRGPEGLPYHDPRTTALIWELKYNKNRRALALAGELLAEDIMSIAEDEVGTPLLIPVPMHAARKRERGHNQTELLCKAACACLGAAHQKESRKGLRSATALGLSDFLAKKSSTSERLLFDVLPEYAPHILERTRHTAPQQGLPRHARLHNVTDSMEVREPARVRGRVCIVVDDVATTGATLAEAARALKHAGARRVHTLALAHS